MRFLSVLCLLLASVTGYCQSSQVGGRTSPDGTEEIRIDLPESLHVANTVGTDGAGLCVWASGKMAGSWAGEPAVCALFEKLQREEGGGWPARVDKEMGTSCPGVKYIQHTGGDEKVLEAVLASGRIACITYGYSPRYRGKINHMVCCVHFSRNWCAVLDCNFPGTIEWMPRAEGVRRWRSGPGGGWLWALCSPPPPPIPTSKPFVAQQVPEQRWVQVAPGSDWFDIWSGGVYLGRFHVPQSDKKVSPPLALTEPEREFCTNTKGVDCSRVATYGDSFCGRRLAPGQVLDAMQKEGMVPDDLKRNYVAVVAGGLRAQEMMDALNSDPECKAYLARCKVRCIDPASPLIAGTKLNSGTDCSLVVMGPEDQNGRAVVLHRQNDFAGGAKAFMEAIRKADPTYTPDSDRDHRKPDKNPLSGPNAKGEEGPAFYTQGWFWSLVLALVALLVPTPLKPLVAMLQALVNRNGNGAAVDLGPILERIKQLESKFPVK